MKLLRFGAAGEERPGLIDAHGHLRDLSGHIADLDGAALSDATLARLRALDTGYCIVNNVSERSYQLDAVDGEAA